MSRQGRGDDQATTEPEGSRAREGRRGAEDLIDDLVTLAADPTSDDATILEKLEVLSRQFSVDEVFDMMARYDTPDLLG